MPLPGQPPGRPMSLEQKAEMFRKEKIVLQERIKGKSFYKIEKEYGIHNPDRVFKRAIAREGNEEYARAEAIRLEEWRLDELQEGIWPKAMLGEPRAVEVALKVLERRARMFGLDFADMISGQFVEIERARVKVMATALVTALNAIDATPDQRRTATTAFLAELRSVTQNGDHQVVPGQIEARDEDLL